MLFLFTARAAELVAGRNRFQDFEIRENIRYRVPVWRTSQVLEESREL